MRIAIERRPTYLITFILFCFSTRLRTDVARVLGLEEGDSHVIRNAGGVVTDDAIRSLTISQRLLGTKDIVLIHHTDCGMLTFTDDAVKVRSATCGFYVRALVNGD